MDSHHSPASVSEKANPLWAAHYADRAGATVAAILENEKIARDTYRLRLKCPSIARQMLPGQFVMLRLPESDDPLLGRPLALYDVVVDASGESMGLDIVYLVVGAMTGRLAECQPGGQLEAWGPLGNGFSPRACGHLVMVAGGIGQTPFLALAKERLGKQRFGDPPRAASTVARTTLCYGARSAEYLAGVDDFAAVGVDVLTSTDDGSAGHHGLVTALLETVFGESSDDCRVVCCGPEPMMEATARIAAARDVPCEVSLETPMACGIGICFSCVAKVLGPDGAWDYKRTCVDGPVFDANRIVW